MSSKAEKATGKSIAEVTKEQLANQSIKTLHLITAAPIKSSGKVVNPYLQWKRADKQ